MRDFRDAKVMAQTIRAALAAKGVKLSISESLELTAKAFGAADWNTLAATIRSERTRSAAARKPVPAPAPPPIEPVRPGQRFSQALEATLHRSVAAAQTRRHSYVTLEHLLLALLDDPDATQVLEACNADRAALRSEATRYLDDDLGLLVQAKDDDYAGPTAGFHRVVQRAVIHVQSSGRMQVTGANILVAMFSEHESRASQMLESRGVSRFDAVNFIAHGVRKGDAAA